VFDAITRFILLCTSVLLLLTDSEMLVGVFILKVRRSDIVLTGAYYYVGLLNFYFYEEDCNFLKISRQSN
jgi:hypothetical protein